MPTLAIKEHRPLFSANPANPNKVAEVPVGAVDSYLPIDMLSMKSQQQLYLNDLARKQRPMSEIGAGKCRNLGKTEVTTQDTRTPSSISKLGIKRQAFIRKQAQDISSNCYQLGSQPSHRVNRTQAVTSPCHASSFEEKGMHQRRQTDTSAHVYGKNTYRPSRTPFLMTVKSPDVVSQQ